MSFGQRVVVLHGLCAGASNGFLNYEARGVLLQGKWWTYLARLSGDWLMGFEFPRGDDSVSRRYREPSRGGVRSPPLCPCAGIRRSVVLFKGIIRCLLGILRAIYTTSQRDLALKHSARSERPACRTGLLVELCRSHESLRCGMRVCLQRNGAGRVGGSNESGGLHSQSPRMNWMLTAGGA